VSDWGDTLEELPALGDLLTMGGFMDWIAPAAGLAGELASVTAAIVVPAGCGYTGHEVAWYLVRNGIAVLGIFEVNENFMLSVADNQVEHARRLLAAAGMLGE